MRKMIWALALVPLMTACVRTVIQEQSAGVGPALVVEQFMRAANAKDLDGMSNLFGTKKGPVSKQWSRREVEQRMFAIATELQHADYELAGEQMVPGRTGEATQLLVRITKDDKKYVVPFTLVRYGKTGWLVEKINIEVLTAPRG